MSNLLQKASIITTPTAYNNGKILSVKPSIVLGAELVTNGSFDTDVNGWNTDSGATLTWQSDQTCLVATSADTTYAIIQGGVLTSGTIYKCSLRFKPNNTGTFRVRLGGNGVTFSTTTFNVNQWNYIEFVGVADNQILEVGSAGGSITEFYIDNVSVKEAIDGDFDFTRNSSATRVNSQGLIEDMQILSGDLVSNGDFSQIGSELVTNGDFATDSDWVKGSGWSISEGKANSDGTQTSTSPMYQDAGIVLGKQYKVTYSVTSYTAGSVRVYLGGTSTGAVSRSATGIYTQQFTALGNQWVTFESDSSFIGSIDNVSVKEVGQDWSLLNGSTINEGVAKVIADGDVGGLSTRWSLKQTVFEANKNYRVKFKARQTSGSGNFQVSRDFFTFIDQAITSSFVEYDITFNSGSSSFSGFLVFGGRTSGNIFEVTNISVIEITDDTNLPRIDYTGGVGHWLFEPQSTNLITYSEDLTQGSVNRLLLTSNADASPDGASTSDKLIPNNTNSAYHYFAFSSLTIATNNVYSVFLKKSEYEYALISFEINGLSGSSDKALINLNNGSIEQSDTETKVDDYGNGWYRCSIKATSARTSVAIYPLPSASLGSFIGDNTSGIIAWGLQLEQQSFATSYIPTNGSTVTRLGETLNNSGSSDLINSTEGVLYAEIAALANIGSFENLSLSNGSSASRLIIFYRNTSNVIEFRVTVSNSIQMQFQYTIEDAKSFNKMLIKYKQNDFAVWVNGFELHTDNNGITFGEYPLSNLSFDNGQVSNPSSPFYGKTKSVAVFKEALSDLELECLTSWNSFTEMAIALGYTIE